jgi:glycine cleavage system H protein
MVPEDLKYAKTHEWARLDAAANIVTMGITDFAVQQLGDIVFLELPKVGAQVTQDTPLGVIESVKAAVDLLAPVTGEVVETNAPLANDLETIGRDPYGQGWMVRIRVAGADALSGLLDPQEYRRHLEAEAKH